jgi:hypothetical protein
MTGKAFDPEVQAAEALDQAIDQVVQTGRSQGLDRGLNQLLVHLAVLHQAPLPEELRVRLHRELMAQGDGERLAIGQREEPGRGEFLDTSLRVVAGLFGAMMFLQGLTFLLAGDRLAAFAGFTYDPHTFREQGILALAVAFGLLVALADPAARLRGALSVAIPLGWMAGLYGLMELPHSQNPLAESYHLLQAGLATALFLLARRRFGRGERGGTSR